jgi:hypothetical protein
MMSNSNCVSSSQFLLQYLFALEMLGGDEHPKQLPVECQSSDVDSEPPRLG